MASEPQLTEAQRETLGRAMHAAGGCECGGYFYRDGDALAPAVERILAEHTQTLGAEVQRLRRWKDEALPVIDGLQELGKALGIGLGQRITGPQAVEAVEKLQAERTNAREITRLATESETGWRREAEEMAVERNRLRAGIEALADTWDANRARNGRPMLTTANVVDRLRALLGGEA